VRWFIVVPLLGIAALLGVVALAGGDEDPGRLIGRVIADPERYDGRTVRVTGIARSAPGPLPVRLNDAFVLEGPYGGRLLVARDGDASWDLTRAVPGLRVSVRGDLAALDPFLQEPGEDAVAIGDVALRAGAAAVLRAGDVQARPR
jgi:hypothetical protein